MASIPPLNLTPKTPPTTPKKKEKNKNKQKKKKKVMAKIAKNHDQKTRKAITTKNGI